LRRNTLPFLNCAKDLLVPHHTTLCPASYRRGGDFAETDGARAEELCLFAPTSRLRREACSSLTIQTYRLATQKNLYDPYDLYADFRLNWTIFRV